MLIWELRDFICKKIEKDDAVSDIRALIEKLHTHYPPYTTFEAHFILMGWSHTLRNYKTPSKKREVQYILSGIEEYYLSKNEELYYANIS